jgi:hypothetical protein
VRTLASASRGSTLTCRATAEGSAILVDLTFARGGRGNIASNLVDEYWSWSAAEGGTNVN